MERDELRPELRLSVTGECNAEPQCPYCFGEGRGLKGKISISQTSDLGETTVKLGLPHVHLTGGEPLTRKDICDLVCVLKEADVDNVALTTNGLLLSERLLDNLHLSGLDEMHVHYRMHEPPTKHLMGMVSYAKGLAIATRLNCPVTDISSVNALLDAAEERGIDVALIEVTEPRSASHIHSENIKTAFRSWVGKDSVHKYMIGNPDEYGEFYRIGDMNVALLPNSPHCVEAVQASSYECPIKGYDNRFWVSGDGSSYYGSDCMFNPAKRMGPDDIKIALTVKYRR